MYFHINSLIHNVYISGHTSKENRVVLLLSYLLTCDHFVKVCIKRLKFDKLDPSLIIS